MFTVADPGFQKRGAHFFFFFFAFQQKMGEGGDNFAKKKNPTTNHRSVFNSARTYQNIPLEIPGIGGGGDLGVLTQKIFKKIGTKSYNSKHF